MDKLLVLPAKQKESILNYMPSDQMLEKLSQFFTVFSDITRIKILTVLCITEMCVNDLSVILNLNQTTVSHQLKYLKQCGAVTQKRSGKMAYYALSTQSINNIMLDGVEYLLAN